MKKFTYKFWIKGTSISFKKIVIFTIFIFFIIGTQFILKIYALPTILLVTTLFIFYIWLMVKSYINGIVYVVDEINSYRIVDHIKPNELTVRSVYPINSPDTVYSRISLKSNKKNNTKPLSETWQYLDIIRKTFLSHNFSPKSSFIFGAGCCSIPIYLTENIKKHKSIAIETNKTIINLAKKYFLPKDNNISLRNISAEKIIKEKLSKKDFILIDMFIGEKFPSAIFDKKIWIWVKKYLKKDGFVIANLGVTGRTKNQHVVIKTLSKIFPHGFIISDNKNLLFIYSNRINDIDNCITYW